MSLRVKLSLPVKAATLSLIVTSLASFGHDAGAAPLSASLALRGAATPAFETVGWGGYYGYGYDYSYYCPPSYGSYAPAYYGGYYGPRSYGGYGYGPYYRAYGYAPSAYRGYWYGY
jgi:hypothetical protein